MKKYLPLVLTLWALLLAVVLLIHSVYTAFFVENYDMATYELVLVMLLTVLHYKPPAKS